MLFLYLLTQDQNTGYDTYDSCVVADKNAQDARFIHPLLGLEWDGGFTTTWSEVADIKVKRIGVAGPDITRGDVICASFNAG